jgi:signal transduction histidine kinase
MSNAQPALQRTLQNEPSDAQARLVALGLMTGGVTHDIRNVLCVIQASLRLVEGAAGHRERQRAGIAGARDAIARGLALTQELLAFARNEPVRPRAGDVNEFIRDAAHLCRCAAASGVELGLSLSPCLPRCVFDEVQLKSALLNIVLNAREAMPHGGAVRIETLARPADAALSKAGFVCVRVADNGPGMSEDVRSRIFDPFFTTKGAAGVGLGLAQARACLRQSGGDLLVASTPGEGAAFDLLLPVAAPGAAGDD